MNTKDCKIYCLRTLPKIKTKYLNNTERSHCFWLNLYSISELDYVTGNVYNLQAP